MYKSLHSDGEEINDTPRREFCDDASQIGEYQKVDLRTTEMAELEALFFSSAESAVSGRGICGVTVTTPSPTR